MSDRMRINAFSEKIKGSFFLFCKASNFAVMLFSVFFLIFMSSNLWFSESYDDFLYLRKSYLPLVFGSISIIIVPIWCYLSYKKNFNVEAYFEKDSINYSDRKISYDEIKYIVVKPYQFAIFYKLKNDHKPTKYTNVLSFVYKEREYFQKLDDLTRDFDSLKEFSLSPLGFLGETHCTRERYIEKFFTQ